MTRRSVMAALTVMCLAAGCLMAGESAVRAEETAIRLANVAPPENETPPESTPAESDAPAENSAPAEGEAPPELRRSEGGISAAPAPAETPVENGAGDAAAAVAGKPAKEPPTDWALYVVGAGVVLALLVGIVRGARG